MQVSSLLSLEPLKYYFNVNNSYVVNKLRILIFPWAHKVLSSLFFFLSLLSHDLCFAAITLPVYFSFVSVLHSLSTWISARSLSLRRSLFSLSLSVCVCVCVSARASLHSFASRLGRGR
jgi:hypothetical protein